MRCWMCNEETGLKETDFGDHKCKICGIMLSIYDKNKTGLEKENKPKSSYDEYLANREDEDMKPPKRSGTDFEKVVIGDMITGVIDDVVYDQEHKFKGFQGKEDTIQPAVRFKFVLEGYKFHHYSRWFKFSYAEKSNLYKLFLTKLVENAHSDMDFDLDLLKGIKVKTLWNENGDFQNLESIFPVGGKVKSGVPLQVDEPQDEEIHPVEDIPDEQE